MNISPAKDNATQTAMIANNTSIMLLTFPPYCYYNSGIDVSDNHHACHIVDKGAFVVRISPMFQFNTSVYGVNDIRLKSLTLNQALKGMFSENHSESFLCRCEHEESTPKDTQEAASFASSASLYVKYTTPLTTQ